MLTKEVRASRNGKLVQTKPLNQKKNFDPRPIIGLMLGKFRDACGRPRRDILWNV